MFRQAGHSELNSDLDAASLWCAFHVTIITGSGLEIKLPSERIDIYRMLVSAGILSLSADAPSS